MTWWTVLLPKKFLSTLSLRRATPAGGCRASGLTFLSTLSLRRATCRCHRQHCPHSYFYPRSPCGERRLHIMIKYIKSWRISIHALLAESDTLYCPPFGEIKLFLSTLSLRRATRCPAIHRCQPVHFYPRSPCGERPPRCTGFRSQTGISIHALLAESDPRIAFRVGKPPAFLSTLSLRRATLTPQVVGVILLISIHALLAESDHGSPHGGIDTVHISIHALLAESDLPATAAEIDSVISIHALLAESDINRAVNIIESCYFYPRSPCGERRLFVCYMIHLLSYFYPRSPCGERPPC